MKQKICYFVNFDKQEELIKKHCFGDCGQICMGCLKIGNDNFIPCAEKECPHLDIQADFKSSVRGERIWLRRLK